MYWLLACVAGLDLNLRQQVPHPSCAYRERDGCTRAECATHWRMPLRQLEQSCMSMNLALAWKPPTEIPGGDCVPGCSIRTGPRWRAPLVGDRAQEDTRPAPPRHVPPGLAGPDKRLANRVAARASAGKSMLSTASGSPWVSPFRSTYARSTASFNRNHETGGRASFLADASHTCSTTSRISAWFRWTPRRTRLVSRSRSAHPNTMRRRRQVRLVEPRNRIRSEQ